MQSRFRFLFLTVFALVVVLVLALGGLVSPARAAITLPTNQTECEALGGYWDEVSAPITYTLCFIPVSALPGICPGFQTLRIENYSFGSFVSCLPQGNHSGAPTGSPGADCILDGGLWYGEYGLDGKCIYPAGTPDALAACGPGVNLVFRLENGVTQLPGTCETPTFSTTRGPGFGRFGMAVNGVSDSGSLALGGGKNGNVTFDPGTCAGKCTISPNLPGGAQGKLPADVVATLYFRTTDTDGNPGTGTYTVCFDASALASPVIYRYVGNEWVAQPLTYSGGQVCTTASADGAFALGGS